MALLLQSNSSQDKPTGILNVGLDSLYSEVPSISRSITVSSYLFRTRNAASPNTCSFICSVMEVGLLDSVSNFVSILLIKDLNSEAFSFPSLSESNLINFLSSHSWHFSQW